MAERVLITGGAGFIGLHLARRLLAEGADVTMLDDFSRGRMDEELRGVPGEPRLVRHDLTTPIPAGLLTGHFDHVYHLAAIVGVGRTMSDPARVLRTNILAAENILSWCDGNPPGAVFLSSTSEVADGAASQREDLVPTPESVPFVLAQPRQPRASYALSKAVCETMFWQRREHFRVRIGRYYNVYGPRMGFEHVIPQFIERVLARRDPFPIYGAFQSRAFCYVDDAVDATVRLTRLPAAEPVLANIGNDEEELQIIDLARMLLAMAGASPGLEVHPAPPASPGRRRPDLGTLRGLLGEWRPVPLADGLRRTFDWYAAQLASAP